MLSNLFFYSRLSDFTSKRFFILLTTLIILPALAGRGEQHVLAQEPDDYKVYLPVILASGAGETPPEEPEAVPGQYVIIWKADTLVDQQAVGGQQQNNPPPDPTVLINMELLDVSELLENGNEALADEIVDSYRTDPDVEAIEPNYIYDIDYTPNDPGLSQQWAWDATGAYQAWDVTQGSSDVVIAIIDTGIQLDHPDLDDKLTPGYDFVDDDSTPEDGNGHGTHVAGTAAAETNNGLGGAGFCPNCRLMPIRTLNNGGSGSLSDVAQGIIYAADNGADVINMSLGGPGSTTMKNAVDYAWSKGVFVACAAGNNGSSRQQYPAGYDNCLAVASTTSSDLRSSFSNYGSWVDVAAPGSSIYSTWRDGRYGSLNGTSMASPHVAGLAGLLASQGLTNDQIRDRLCASADQIDGSGSLWRCGRINADRAVRGAGTPLPTPTSTPQPQPTATPDPSVPTPTPTTTPPPANNALLNGDFEEGYSGWSFSANDIISSDQVFSQANSARLDGTKSSNDSIVQSVKVPANGVLTYYWYPAEGDGKVRVEITRPGLRFSMGLDATNGHWYKRSIKLGGLAGQTIQIKFSAETDETDSATFYLDKVTLQ